MTPFGPVLVVGAGLIGTSLGLALTQQRVPVFLEDLDSARVSEAVGLGAGAPMSTAVAPTLVVVAVPPQQTPAVIDWAHSHFPAAVVTDVSSVKEPVVRTVSKQHASHEWFVPGHPMAGREVSGPGAALADLFRDRPWALCAEGSDASATALVRELIGLVGAVPVELTAAEHDRAVALTSHAPQVVASLLAGRLADADRQALAVAGQGLRDTTRIAASDPGLWAQIIAENREQVHAVLHPLAADLRELLISLDSTEPETAGGAARRVVELGRAGVSKLPGKHGADSAPQASLRVAVPDRTGALADLLDAVRTASVNVEDMRIEHALGRPTGLVELVVPRSDRSRLQDFLQTSGWSVRS